MDSIALLLSVLFALVGLAALLRRLTGALDRWNELKQTELEQLETGSQPVHDPGALEELRARFEAHENAVEEQFKQYLLALSDGVERVARAENRVTKTVQSARRKLKEFGVEHAGLEAEYQEIRERDEESGGGEGVPPVPVHVEPSLEVDRPSGIPGVTEFELRAWKEGRSGTA